jgi:hypothetical protein
VNERVPTLSVMHAVRYVTAELQNGLLLEVREEERLLGAGGVGVAPLSRSSFALSGYFFVFAMQAAVYPRGPLC